MRHPTALVCYNRPQHLGRVLAALRKYKPEPLYVFCDGPKDEADTRRVLAVRQMLEGIGWTHVELVARPRNVGLAASVVGAVDHVLARHETVILLEDDCVPGPYFYDFVGACLERYRNQPVLSVSGYTVRLPDRALDGYGWDAYFTPRIGSWGWATWRDRWAFYERKLNAASLTGLDLCAGGNDVPGLVQGRLAGKLDAWTPGWIVAGYRQNMMSVYPTRSHIANIGMDGSGTHSGKGGKWGTPPAEGPSNRLPDVPVIHRPIIDAFMEYYNGYSGG